MFRMCGFDGALQVRDARLRAQERAARVHLVHQVEPLHRRVERAGQADRATRCSPGCRFRRTSRPPAPPRARPAPRRGCQSPPRARARRHPRFPRAARVDRAGQLRVRLRRLRRDDDVRPVARRAQRDRLADATARAGDEHRLPAQALHAPIVRRKIVGAASGRPGRPQGRLKPAPTSTLW